jgi:hypothetical protein
LVAVVLICWAFALEVSPNNPSPGSKINIAGTASPGAQVDLQSSFQMNLPVFAGRYEYETSVEIPHQPNRFTVSASNIKDLGVGVKMVIWLTKSFDAPGGTATLSQSNVPPGRYTVKLFGESLPGAASVPVKVSADTTVQADSKGQYSLVLDTAGVPAGDYTIAGGGETRVIHLGTSAAAPSESTESSTTLTPAPAAPTREASTPYTNGQIIRLGSELTDAQVQSGAWKPVGAAGEVSAPAATPTAKLEETAFPAEENITQPTPKPEEKSPLDMFSDWIRSILGG